MKKSILVLLISLLSLTLFVGCSNNEGKKSGNESESEGKKVVLKYAYGQNSKPVNDAIAKFGELVSEKTDGQVTVEFFPDGQLGSERELIELVQTGTIQLAKVSGAQLESFSDKYSIFGLPYLFDDENHFYNVMESDIVDGIYQSTKEQGFIGLNYYDSGQRSFYTSYGPVNHPDDLKGKKIRVMQSETAIKMVGLLGGSATPMGAGEVYTSLQQGVLDGAENNEFALTEGGHAGVTKFYSYDEHTRVPDVVVINEAALSGLSEDQRNAVYEAADESTQYQKSLWKDAIEATKKRAEDEFGVKFNTVDKKPFQDAVAPMHEEMKQKAGLGEIYEAIKKLSTK